MDWKFSRDGLSGWDRVFMVSEAEHQPAQRRESSSYRVAAPFGLPLWLAFCIVCVYTVTPESVFWVEWGVPKIGQAQHILYYGLALIVFGLASWLAAAVLASREAVIVRTTLMRRRVLQRYASLGLCAALLGYVVWASLGVYRAGSIAKLLSARMTNPYFVKSVLLDTIPGVTTVTQVAVLAIPVWWVLRRRKAHEIGAVVLLFILGLVRSQLFLERLAIIELVVPLGFLVICQRRLSLRRLPVLILAFVVAMGLFFTGSELTRALSGSWDSGGPSVLRSGLIRFAGYYLTSVNNGVLAIQAGAATPLWHTFRSVWRFPGLEGLYSRLLDVDIQPKTSVLESAGLNPEFNTSTAIGAWVSDYGQVGGIVWAAIMGAISGTLWGLGKRDVLMRALYAVWLVGELELMRIDYFSGTRLFPAYMFWLGAVVLRTVRSTGGGSA